MNAADFLAVAPLAAPAADAPLDLIFIEGFEAPTVIGIHSGEHVPQPVRIDLAAGVPRAGACDSDDIADTLDYSEIRLALHTLLQQHGVRLLEALAESIARMLIDDFGAHWVRVKVAKPRKFADVDAVGVMIERRRTASKPVREVPVLTLIGRGMVPRA
jgi:dihydroneopterin aldolase